MHITGMARTKDEAIAYRILLMLSKEEKRYSELLPFFQKTTMSKTLKDLTKLGYVERDIKDATPPQTYYKLTERGKKFLSERAKEVVAQMSLELASLKPIVPNEIARLRARL